MIKQVPPEAEYQFSSLKEFEQTILGIYNLSGQEIVLTPDDPNMITFDCGDGMYRGFVSIGPTYSLNFRVTIMDGKISAVGSGLSGFHLGVSWSQGGWFQSGSNVYVGGTFTAGLGFGVFSWSPTYTLVLPC